MIRASRPAAMVSKPREHALRSPRRRSSHSSSPLTASISVYASSRATLRKLNAHFFHFIVVSRTRQEIGAETCSKTGYCSAWEQIRYHRYRTQYRATRELPCAATGCSTYPVGMVTTGAGAFSPVSTGVKTNIKKEKIFFENRSLSSIKK